MEREFGENDGESDTLVKKVQRVQSEQDSGKGMQKRLLHWYNCICSSSVYIFAQIFLVACFGLFWILDSTILKELRICRYLIFSFFFFFKCFSRWWWMIHNLNLMS